jgi:hypothetical protein
LSTLAIELNDAGITPLGDDSRLAGELLISPGYAVVDGGAIVTGAEALGQARLKPRHEHHRFWSRLDTQPIGRPFPADLSSADLAHAHLSSVWKRVRAGVDRVIIALPGSHSEQQMGLILGIAQACEIPVEGIVDAAVAAAATVSPSGPVLHLDLELNGVVLTELACDRELVRKRVQVGDHTGWIRLRDAWAKRVARHFVSRTRFDPLHVATTEQALHGRLVELLPLLCRQACVEVELEAGGRVYTVEVERDDLIAAVAADYDGLVQLVEQLSSAGQPSTILLTDRVAGLPGFEDRLAEVAKTAVVRLPPAAAAAGALRHVDLVRSPGEAVPYITRLSLAGPAPAPVVHGPRPPVAPRRSDESSLPTHVVHQGRAYRVTDRPFVVGTAVPPDGRGLELADTTPGLSRVHCSIRRSGGRVIVEDHSSQGSFLNDQRVAGATPVAAGDRLRVGVPGVELRFITVTDEDAAPRD